MFGINGRSLQRRKPASTLWTICEKLPDSEDWNVCLTASWDLCRLGIPRPEAGRPPRPGRPGAPDRNPRPRTGDPASLNTRGRFWNVTAEVPFDEEDAHFAVDLGLSRPNAGFLPSRWRRATERERRYMGAMARSGEDQPRSGTAAELIGSSATAVSDVRDSPLNKGLILGPNTTGSLSRTWGFHPSPDRRIVVSRPAVVDVSGRTGRKHRRVACRMGSAQLGLRLNL